MNQVCFGWRGPLGGALLIFALTSAFAAPGALAGPIGSDTETLSDLRGFVPTTSLVGEGNLQLETSVSRAMDGEGTSSSWVWTTPTVVRFGMPNYEIRIQSAGYSRVRTYTALDNGMSDLGVGLKGIVPQSLHRDLSLAVLLQAAFPSGSSALKNKGVRPELQLISQWQLPSNHAITGVAGVRSDVDITDSRFATGMAGVNYSYTWNPQFDTYAEFAAREIRSETRGGSNLMYDVGASWRALPATQLNASLGWGLKQDDTNLAWTVGVSRRFRPPVPGAISRNRPPKTEEKKTDETPRATTEDGQ